MEGKRLFILSPPFSGSTLVHDVIATSDRVTQLPAEGQHLPEVKDWMRSGRIRGKHWDSSHTVPWERVRGVWDTYWDEEKPVRLEKSPPNLLRAKAMEDAFDSSFFIVMIGDPYAFCEGCARRANELDAADSARLWIRCARKQTENLEELSRALLVRYEDFVEHTEEMIQQIGSFIPEIQDIEAKPSSTFSVLGRGQNQIWNINAYKRLQLRNDQIRQINGVLEEDWRYVERFGYNRMDPGIHQVSRRFIAVATKQATRAARYLAGAGIISNALERSTREITKRLADL
ncbi:sulfotransferase [Salinibacter ruber]|uniref:sulfotransferase n=1 Tax=Salinibacter ruber TaxID=146919 RepID=UPI002169A99D|nr:sulfotransferase [Salinibacter ruber]